MRKFLGMVLMLVGLFILVPPVQAGEQALSLGNTPINDLGTGLYLGLFQGGLYPDGSNAMPALHDAEGQLRAAAITPLNTSGNPDAAGKIVLLSIGISNAMMEFCGATRLNNTCKPGSFTWQAVRDPAVNHQSLFVVNGAKGRQETSAWIDPQDSNYDEIRDQMLLPQGLSETQVQVIWLKSATIGPSRSLPASDADAYKSLALFGQVVRALKVRYPNLQMVFISSRTYAGNAMTPLNPEPFAYEYGFSVKWLVEAQINQMAGGGVDPLAGDLDYTTVAPWMAWGPYLWEDGANPRSDGLTWEPEDFLDDGVHPSPSGVQKVGDLMMNFFTSSAHTAPWFTSGPASPGTLAGAVTVQGRAVATGVTASAILWNTVAVSQTTSLSGTFGFALAPGRYRVAFDLPGYLRTEVTGLELPAGGSVQVPVQGLFAGDVNDDGVIDGADVGLIAAAYDLTCADPGWNPSADLNADCVVNIQDASLAAGNQGMVEPVIIQGSQVLRRQSYLLKWILTRP